MGVREEAVPRPQAKQLLSREPWRSRAMLAPCFLARPACGHAAMETSHVSLRSQPQDAQNSGAIPLPLLPNMPQPTPALVAGTFQDQGLASFSVALICPQHPSAQVFPPAKLSPPPAQKVEGRRSLLQPFTVAADSHLQTSTGPFSVPPAHSGCP